MSELEALARRIEDRISASETKAGLVQDKIVGKLDTLQETVTDIRVVAAETKTQLDAHTVLDDTRFLAVENQNSDRSTWGRTIFSAGLGGVAVAVLNRFFGGHQ